LFFAIIWVSFNLSVGTIVRYGKIFLLLLDVENSFYFGYNSLSGEADCGEDNYRSKNCGDNRHYVVGAMPVCTLGKHYGKG